MPPLQTQFPATFLRRNSNQNALTALLEKFETPEGDFALLLRRGGVSDAGASYHVLLGRGAEALHFPLGGVLSFVADAAAPELGNYSLVGLIGGVYHGDTTKSGSWSTLTSAGYGSSYTRAAASGAYIEYTTPNNVTEIGIWDLAGVQAAVALVEIDGDRTLANALPTTQDLIISGRLDSSVLVTNGGTLYPTDRILDAANPLSAITAGFLDTARKVRLASNLGSGQHTVRVTHTGYRPIGGSSDFVRLYGFWFDDPAATVADIPTAMPTIVSPNPISVSGSDINFAFNYRPVGGSVSEWMGHSGSQFTTTAELYVDDVLVSPILAADPYKIGSKAELRITGYCRHPESVENVATYSQRFVFTPEDGVEIYHSFTWLVAGTATGYIPQLSVNNAMSKGSLLEADQDYDLSADAGGGFGNIPASAAYFWTPGGQWAALACVPEYENNPIGKIWLQDRSGGGLNKVYFERYLGSNIVAGETIELRAIYRFKRFDDADVELART